MGDWVETGPSWVLYCCSVAHFLPTSVLWHDSQSEWFTEVSPSEHGLLKMQQHGSMNSNGILNQRYLSSVLRLVKNRVGSFVNWLLNQRNGRKACHFIVTVTQIEPNLLFHMKRQQVSNIALILDVVFDWVLKLLDLFSVTNVVVQLVGALRSHICYQMNNGQKWVSILVELPLSENLLYIFRTA